MVRITNLLCLLVLAGCASQKHNNASQPHHYSKADFSLGDFVSITTSDGQKLDFKITMVSRTGIAGKDIEFAYEDMQDVEIEITSDRAEEETTGLEGPVEFVGGLFVYTGVWLVGAGIAVLLMAL